MAIGPLGNGGLISKSSVPIITRRLHRSEITFLRPVSARLRQRSPEGEWWFQPPISDSPQFAHFFHQSEPAFERLCAIKEGWVKEQFVCADPFACQYVVLDLFKRAGENHPVFA